jgi:hypothetical protein
MAERFASADLQRDFVQDVDRPEGLVDRAEFQNGGVSRTWDALADDGEGQGPDEDPENRAEAAGQMRSSPALGRFPG